MRRLTLLAVLVLISGLIASAQPSISGIVNAASYATAPPDANGKPIGNNNIAQGSIFVIFGAGMGPAALVQATSLPLSTSLPDANGTSVAITSGGQTVNAYLIYTLDKQVAAILPSNAAAGAATVTVTYNGKTSSPAPVNVVKTQFGIFTQNQQGNGPAIAQVFTSSTDVALMGLTTAVQPGQTVVLYGTGLGAISGADNVPPGAVAVGANVAVNIAGETVAAAYAGRSPQFPGLDQVNFTVPADAATGCYIPAEVTASGRPSNLFYLSIAGAGAAACTHPLGLPASALSKLDSFGTINTGLFLLLRAVVLGQPAEGAGGLFANANSNATFQLFSRILLAFGGYNYPIPAGSCAVMDTIDPPAGFSVPDFATLGGKELKPADFVNLAGTNGNSAVLPRSDTGGYLTVFFNTLGKGTWTLSTTGAGADVGAFSAKADLPENLIWTNAGNFANPPRTDLTIVWTGGANTAQSLVTALGSSVVVNPNDPSKSRGKAFFCNAAASAGKIVVPAAVTQQLPSANGLDSGEVYFGQLGIYAGGGAAFQAPLVSGGNTDGAFLAYGEAHTLSVKFQ